MRYEESEFVNTEVELDGNTFEACKFTNCVLVYRGGTVNFTHCEFYGPRFAFRDAAEATLSFMTALYAGGAKAFIEEIFQAIRDGGQPGPRIDPSNN